MSRIATVAPDTAVDGDPGVNVTLRISDGPVQSGLAYRWKMTLPVGSGTEGGVPGIRVTATMSRTSAPPTIVVTVRPAVAELEAAVRSSTCLISVTMDVPA